MKICNHCNFRRVIFFLFFLLRGWRLRESPCDLSDSFVLHGCIISSQATWQQLHGHSSNWHFKKDCLCIVFLHPYREVKVKSWIQRQTTKHRVRILFQKIQGWGWRWHASQLRVVDNWIKIWTLIFQWCHVSDSGQLLSRLCWPSWWIRCLPRLCYLWLTSKFASERGL